MRYWSCEKSKNKLLWTEGKIYTSDNNKCHVKDNTGYIFENLMAVEYFDGIKFKEVFNVEKKNLPVVDKTNPNYYKSQCSLECIEAMQMAFGVDAVYTFCICNAWKYMWRYENKKWIWGRYEVQMVCWKGKRIETRQPFESGLYRINSWADWKKIEKRFIKRFTKSGKLVWIFNVTTTGIFDEYEVCACHYVFEDGALMHDMYFNEDLAEYVQTTFPENPRTNCLINALKLEHANPYEFLNKRR